MLETDSQSSEVIILVGKGFDESALIPLVGRFREAGVETEVIGVQLGLLRGKYGIEIKPDTYLGRLENATPRLTIFTGCVNVKNQFLTDPRVYRLITQTLKIDGHVAFTHDAESIASSLLKIVRARHDQFLLQATLDIKIFSKHLLAKLIH